MNDIRQKPRPQQSPIDEELMGHKGRKSFKSAAYSFGLAIGFLLLAPLVPEIGDPQKQIEIMKIFSSTALWMIGYSVVITLAFFFLRAYVNGIISILNWFFVPTVLIWALYDIYNLLTAAEVAS